MRCLRAATETLKIVQNIVFASNLVISTRRRGRRECDAPKNEGEDARKVKLNDAEWNKHRCKSVHAQQVRRTLAAAIRKF